MLLLLLEFVTDEQREAFTNIYRTYEGRMYAVALSILHHPQNAEDAVYASFVKIIEHLEKILELPCHEQPPYIVTIVKNTSRDILRGDRKVDELPEDWDIPVSDPSPEQRTVYRELLRIIHFMPATYRDVLEMHLILRMTVREIADQLQLKENTVSVKIKRGRKILKERLIKEGYWHD